MIDPIDLPLPETMPSLAGETALVTGTTSGLGRRFAYVLGAAGARVVLTGRRTERLSSLAGALAARGADAISLDLDVTEEADIVRVAAAAEERFGPVSILVNNAGINVEGAIVDLAAADFDRIMATNVRGAFLMSREIGRRMMAAKVRGRIINVASIGAFTVLPGLSAYCISKAAIAMMTKTFAREWARHEINVNAICPGYIETELNTDWFQSEGGQKQIKGFARRRLGTEADLDDLLLMLASPRSRFVTGALFTADDGQSL